MIKCFCMECKQILPRKPHRFLTFNILLKNAYKVIIYIIAGTATFWQSEKEYYSCSYISIHNKLDCAWTYFCAATLWVEHSHSKRKENSTLYHLISSTSVNPWIPFQFINPSLAIDWRVNHAKIQSHQLAVKWCMAHSINCLQLISSNEKWCMLCL